MSSKNEEDRWYSEAGAVKLLKPIFEAVEQIHKRGIVHRDICLSKVAIRTSKDSEVRLELHGFEYAIYLQPKYGGWTTVKQKALTFDYRATTAPELKAGFEHGRPVDIYGLGQIAYQLLCSTSSWEPQILQASSEFQN